MKDDVFANWDKSQGDAMALARTTQDVVGQDTTMDSLQHPWWVTLKGMSPHIRFYYYLEMLLSGVVNLEQECNQACSSAHVAVGGLGSTLDMSS